MSSMVQPAFMVCADQSAAMFSCVDIFTNVKGEEALLPLGAMFLASLFVALRRLRGLLALQFSVKSV